MLASSVRKYISKMDFGESETFRIYTQIFARIFAWKQLCVGFVCLRIRIRTFTRKFCHGEFKKKYNMALFQFCFK